MSPGFRFALLTLLILAHAAGLFYVGVIADGITNDSVGLAMGIAFSQAGLLAVWLCFSRGQLISRVVAASLLTCVVCLTFVVYVLRTPLGSLSIGFIFSVAILTQFAGQQIPLWLLRRLGYRSYAPHEGVANVVAARRFQFNVKQLFWAAGGWALLLSAARILLGPNPRVWQGDTLEWILFFGLLTAFSLMLAIPVTIVVLLCRQWISVSALLVLGYTGLVGSLQFEASRFLGAGPRLNASFFLVFNASQLLWLAGSLLIVRLIGFRWERHPK